MGGQIVQRHGASRPILANPIAFSRQQGGLGTILGAMHDRTSLARHGLVQRPPSNYSGYPDCLRCAASEPEPHRSADGSYPTVSYSDRNSSSF